MLKKNLSIVFIGGFSRSVFGIIQGFLIAKFLGAKSYGIFSLSLSYVALVFGFIDFKIAEAVIKFISEFRPKQETDKINVISIFFVAAELIKGFVSSIIIIGTSWWAANTIYGKPFLFRYILILSLSSLFLAVNPTLTAFLRLGSHYKLISWYDFLLGFFSLIFIGTIVYTKRSIWSVAIAYALIGFVGLISKSAIFYWAFRKRLHFKKIMQSIKNWKALSIPWKRIIHFSLYLNLTSTFRYITKNIDVLILGKFVSLEGVGAYSLARRIGNLFSFVTDPLLIVIYPEMARMWAENQIDKLKRFIKKITIASGAIVLVGYVILGFSATCFIPKLFGRDFTKSASVLWLCMPGVVISVGLFWLYHLLLTLGAMKVFFWSSLIQMISMILLVPLLSYYWQENGAALAMSIALIIYHLYSLFGIKKYFVNKEFVNS